nr:PREDICTED: gastrin/cholecystokinin type B receptor [Bemisia tabaci]
MKDPDWSVAATGLNSLSLSWLNVSSADAHSSTGAGNSSLGPTAELLSAWLSSPAAITLLVSFYIVVLTIGLFGNTLVAVAILSQKLIRNFLLLNLCISDFFVCIMSGPISIAAALNHVWSLGAVSCRLAFFFQTIPVAASTLSLMMLSLDRYTSIKHPRIMTRAQSATRVQHWMVAAIWLLAALVSGPLLWARHVSPGGGCEELWPSRSFRAAYTVVLMLVVYVVPSLTVAICHHSVGHKLYATSLKAAAANGDIPLPMPIIPNRPKEVIIIASVHNDAPSKIMQFRAEEESESSVSDTRRGEKGSGFRHHRHAAIRRKKRERERAAGRRSGRHAHGHAQEGAATGGAGGSKVTRLRPGPPTAAPKPRPPLTKQMSRQSLNSRKRLANMLVAMVVVFVTCWFPYVIVKVSLEFDTEMEELLRSVLPFCLLLGHTHSTINPLVYWSLNRQSLQLNASCYDWLKRGNRDSSHQESKFYFANHLRFLSNHNPGRQKHHPPPSSTNEAALGVFHPRYTVPKPQNRLNQKRESSVYLA